MEFKTQTELLEMNETQLKEYQVKLEDYRTANMKNEVATTVKAEIETATQTLKDFLGNEIAGQISELTKAGKIEEKELTKAFIANANSFETNNKNHSFSQTIKAAALMTTANVVPNVSGGFSPLFGNYIDTEVGNIPKPELSILPLVNIKTQPGTEVVYHTSRYNEEGDAQFIAEGGLKPLADAEWKTDSTPAKEVAVRWKFTKRLMKHAPSVVSDFMEHANELMEQKMDDGALDGDGTGNNLLGITATGVASAFVVPTLLANFYTKANIYDVINAVATQVRLSNFRGQLTCVLNTVYEAQMKGIKDLEGNYIVPPFVNQDGTKIGSINILFNNKIADTHILLGDLRKYNIVICEDIEYDEGYENDDFSKNLVSKKLEAFLGSYIKRADAGSIVYDAIASILTDIEFVPAP